MGLAKLFKFIILILFTTVLVSCGGESQDADPIAVEGATNPNPAPSPNTDFSVNVNQSSSQPDPTTVVPISFRFVFGRKIDEATFTAVDITQSGTATGVSWAIAPLGNSQSFIITATAVGTEGTVVPTLAAGVVQDSTGANNLASVPLDGSVFFDAQLAVIIGQKTSQADPTNTFPIEYDVTFTAPIDTATFTTADITQNGTATGVTWNIINLGDDTNFTLQATGATSDGTITPSIDAGIVDTPVPIETNLASTSTDNEVTYNDSFGVTIDQKIAQLDPTANFNIEFDVVFAEAIDNLTFDASDITNTGTATGIVWNIINSGDDINFTLQATGGVGEGTIIPEISAGLVQTATLKNNSVSTNLTDGEVTWRTTFDVTVDQKVAQADPADSLPIEFDVVFSEAIDNTTFTTADITQNGTAPDITWNIINSGDDINFTLQATAATGIGTVTPSIATSLVQTVDGANNNASTSTDNEVTYAPTYKVTIEQKVAQNDPAATLPIEFDVVFSQAIDNTTFTIADITQSGTATGITWNIINSGDNTNYTLQATAIVGEGTVIPSMAQNVTQDSIGAYNLASTSVDNSVNYRTTFNVTIDQKGAQADPVGTLPIEYDVVFSEAIDPASFTIADVTDVGSAGGVTWNIINSGDNINFTLQATAAVGTGTIIPILLASVVQTTDGANNNASTATDNTVTYNGSIEVTIDQKDAQADPTAATPIEYDVVFSEAIDNTTFTAADITQTGTATGISWNIINSGDDINFTVQATVISGDGTVIPVINNNKVQTSGGKINNPSTSTDNQVTYNTIFDVTVDQKGAQADPTGVTPVEFDVVFSEAIDATTFTPADIIQNGTATNPTWNIINSGDDTNFTLQMTLADTSGTVIPSINATQIQTSYGANNNASTSTDNSVLYVPPFDVTIEQKGAQTDPTASFNIEFDVVFSEAIDDTTFTTADITQGGTATGVTWNIINSGDDTNYTLQATGAATEGTIIPYVNALIISTTAGGLNTASSSTDNSVLYRTTFDVTVDETVAQTDPAATFNIEFDVVFTEAIDNTTFTTADITQNGTATGVTWNLVNSGNDTNYTLQATGTATEGTIIPSINASVIQTTDGANNNASTATDNSVLYRTTFDVTINQKDAQADPATALPIEFDVVFTEAVDASTFTAADITQNGTATVGAWTVTDSGDHTNFIIRATVVSASGTVIPSITGSAVQAKDGANNTVSTSTDNSVTYTPPFKTTVNQKAAQADPTTSLPIEFDVVFGKAVDDTTFTVDDITQSGTATGVTWAVINSGDDINFTLRATAVSGEGTLIPSIGAGSVQTTLGGANSSSTSADNSVLYNTSFDVTVNQKGTQADPTSSFNVEFDVVFTEAIDATTFTTADIVQNGTAPGVTWNIVNSGDDINFTLQATSSSNEGTIQPSINATTIVTTYGADNTASTSTDNTVTITYKFDVTINQKGAQPDPTANLPIEWDVVFAEAIAPATFTTADITQGGTAGGITWNIINSGDNTNFTLQATAVTTEGTLIPSLANAVVADNGPKSNNPSTSTDGSVTYDLTKTVVLTLTGGNSIVANGVTTTELTANVQNVEGQNVSGNSVSLNIPTNGGTDNGPIVTDGSGNAVFTLTSSTVANTYNGYTATTNGDISAALNGVIFIAGPPASITLTLTGNTDIAADGAATSTFTANVKDAFSNNCPSESVTLNIPANGGTTTNPATTDANGDAFFTLTSSTIVGSYNYDATVNALTSTPQIGLNFRTAELSWDITFWDAGLTEGIVTQTFTLTNDGLITSGTLSVIVSGNQKHLSLVPANDNCNGITLAPSASCTVEVEWDGSRSPPGLDEQTLDATGTPGGAPSANIQGTKP